MPRMLTEEEVEMIEKQRGLQERKAAAIAGMTANERLRFREAEEREMWDRRYREKHGGLSRAEVAAAGPNGSGRQYAAIKRGFELQAARANEMERLGKELATRETEAHERRMGMAEQGMRAAEFNKEAAIRAAELQTASAQKIAGMNAASNEKIAGINTASAEKINEDRNKSAEEVATINKEGNVEAAAIQAREQAAQQYAQNLMKQRQVDEESAWNFAKKRADMIAQMRAKQKDLSEDAAARLVDERLKGGLPGKPRKFQF